MKKYFTEILDYDIKSEATFSDNGTAEIDGKQYSYNYRFLNDNVLILRMNDVNHYITITNDEDYTEFDLNSVKYKAITKNEFDILLEKISINKGESKDKKEIYSPMPGIISKLHVSEGQKVSKGEVLFVLEAMKMENEIKAKKDCVIKKVNVGEKKSVEKNELLIVLE